MGNLKFWGAFVLLCMLYSATSAQKPDSALTNFYDKSSFEKVYTQFDNTRYAPGQTIWYKAYIMSGVEPSQISKNFYTDWYDENGKLISSTITPIVNGSSSGSYTIPQKYTGSSIQAISYTKWMRNFDSAYFFEKKFQITSSASKQEKTVSVFPETTVQFLPESGNTILNKQNVIAFKAVNQSGLPQYIDGYIKNKEGDTITSFNSVHDGMGKFQYMPFANETYTAVWNDILGNTHQTALPPAQEFGINLILEAGNANRIFHIQRTEKVPESMKKISVIAQMNGIVLFKASANLLDKESVSSNLPVSKFGSGILQLTVFDANKQPLCERLLFVKNEDYILNTTVHFDTLNTEKRGKNVFEIELKDTTSANLSVAITDADLNDSPDNTIASQLLLKGDLAGNIYKPAYYFSSNADSVSNHLDLVMLTNGWRRFKWQNILNNPSPVLPYEKDSAYLTLIGRVEGITDAKIKKAVLMNLILLSKDSSKSMLFLPIQPDGSFSEKNVLFFDTAKIFYKLNGTKLSFKSNVLIENDFFKIDANRIIRTVQNNIDTIGLSKFQYLIDEQKRVALLTQKTTLKEVTVYAKRKTRMEELEKKYTSGMFTGDARAVFDLTSQDAIGALSVFDYLNGRVAGLQFTNVFGGTPRATWRGGSPSFYLDEFATTADNIQNISLIDIAYIKVFSPPFMGGFGGAGGAIAIYTKKGADMTISSRGMDYAMVSGYAPIREFYAPNYAEKEQAYSTPDLRATLLWNPWISLDKENKKTKISFYNNDLTHKFRLILEGMDNEGKLVHFSKLLQ